MPIALPLLRQPRRVARPGRRGALLHLPHDHDPRRRTLQRAQGQDQDILMRLNGHEQEEKFSRWPAALSKRRLRARCLIFEFYTRAELQNLGSGSFDSAFKKLFNMVKNITDMQLEVISTSVN